MRAGKKGKKITCGGCKELERTGHRFDPSDVVHDKDCPDYEPETISLRWTSVKDGLPKNQQRVLIAEYDPHYSSAAISGEYFTDAGFVYVDAREGMRRGKDVRYWMPSPPIPAE